MEKSVAEAGIRVGWLATSGRRGTEDVERRSDWAAKPAGPGRAPGR